MPRINAANNARTTLVGAIDALQTEFTVADLALFPEPPFRVAVDDEIMEIGATDRVTRIVSSVLRAQEGSAAAAHGAGAGFDNRITAGTYAELLGPGHESAAVLPHADGSVTDPKIGTRTPDDTKAAAGGAQTLTDALSMLANRVKAITGEDAWTDDPDATVASLKGDMDLLKRPIMSAVTVTGVTNIVDFTLTDDDTLYFLQGNTLNRVVLSTGARTILAAHNLASYGCLIRVDASTLAVVATNISTGYLEAATYDIAGNAWTKRANSPAQFAATPINNASTCAAMMTDGKVNVLVRGTRATSTEYGAYARWDPATYAWSGQGVATTSVVGSFNGWAQALSADTLYVAGYGGSNTYIAAKAVANVLSSENTRISSAGAISYVAVDTAGGRVISVEKPSSDSYDTVSLITAHNPTTNRRDVAVGIYQRCRFERGNLWLVDDDYYHTHFYKMAI